MKTLIGGTIAAALGLIGLVIWFSEFLQVLAGIIPVMLLFAGCLAIYLGFDELKETWKGNDTEDTLVEDDNEVEKYKKEIDQLKEEIETLKKP
ncbi:MAG: hypothetical protein MUP22_13355 [Desulfobacterales bacterium]|nr:hypothetical protein [Desulfobacterales bacterium]